MFIYELRLVCCHFIVVAPKQYSTKPLTKTISNIFKMIHSHVESFHKQSQFHSNFKPFDVAQNSFPTAENLIKINHKKTAKATG